MPIKTMLKISARGFRLAPLRSITIAVLCVIALTFFVLAVMLAAFDTNRATAAALYREGGGYVTFARHVDNEGAVPLIEEDIARLEGLLGGFDTIFVKSILDSPYVALANAAALDNAFFGTVFSGFAPSDVRLSERFGIIGELPRSENQVALTKFSALALIEAENFLNFEKMLLSPINIDGEYYTISGIIDTGFELGRYRGLMDLRRDVSHDLAFELSYKMLFSHHSRIFVYAPLRQEADVLTVLIDFDSVRQARRLLAQDFSLSDGEYIIFTHVTYSFQNYRIAIESLSENFGAAAWVIAIFAALLIGYFATFDVTLKKKMIGVLRTFGASKKSIYKIFGIGALVFGLFNFVVSWLLALAAAAVLNHIFRTALGILLPIMSANVLSVLLLFALSVSAHILSTFLMVHRILRRTPIEIIQQ